MGLAKDDAVGDDNCVRSENPISWTAPGNRQSFVARQAFSTVLRGLSRQRIFVDVGRLNRKRNPGVAQKFLAARRGRGKHEHGHYGSEDRMASTESSAVRRSWFLIARGIVASQPVADALASSPAC